VEDKEVIEEWASPLPKAEPKRPAAHKRAGRITRRQREVALLIGQGMTNRQIGQALGLSEHTVANHVAKILKKLGFRSRAQVAAWMAG
jgi:DNA-binding NarL/FixJ family response regulator